MGETQGIGFINCLQLFEFNTKRNYVVYMESDCTSKPNTTKWLILYALSVAADNFAFKNINRVFSGHTTSLV